MDDKRLNEIKQHLSQISAAPWIWRKNEYRVELISPPHGWCLVMDFVRRGMQSAQPRFSDRSTNRTLKLGGIMRTADEIGDIETNPDAAFISNSRLYVEELVAEVDRLRQESVAAIERTENAEWQINIAEMASTQYTQDDPRPAMACWRVAMMGAQIDNLRAENERLRDALRRIANQEVSLSGLDYYRLRDIAKNALAGQSSEKEK